MTDNAPIDTQPTQDTPTVNPSASPSTQPSALPPPSTSTSTDPPSQKKGKSQNKGKKPKTKTKARPRRRVAASDSEPEEDGGASDGSLTDPSSASDSEPDPDTEEQEEEEEVKESKPQLEKEKEKETNEVISQIEQITLEDSNRGGTSIKGKDKGKAGSNGVKREYTAEETKKYEEMKARRKEKQKAKKAELREIKRKEKESQPQSAKPVVDSKPAVEADEESTVPLVADGSPPPPASTALPNQNQNQRGRRGSKSQRRQSVVHDDPKIVPRQGQFWTHDQRSDPQPQQAFSGARGLPDWRGRGGFRGRGGRGGFPAFGRFPQQNSTLINQGQELTKEIPVESEKEDGDEPVLAMDRLEKEMAKKERQPSATAVVPPKEKKWGHEAFEQIQTEKDKRALPSPSPAVIPRGGLRGLPRGRGRGFGPRGGHLGQPFRQPLSSLPFHPANLAATAAAAAAKSATATATTSTSTAPAPASVPNSTVPAISQPPSRPLPKAEAQSTQPDSDDLLGESSQAVTIKLPGSSNTVEVAVVHPPQEQKGAASAEPVPETVAAPVETPELNASGQAILYTSPVPPPQPITHQPQPQAPHMYPNVSAPSPYPPGSENGSMSSGMSHTQFVPTHPYPQKSHLQQNVVPPPSGYGMGSEFVPSARPQVHVNGGGAAQARSFYPSAAPRSYPAQRPFYPQQQQSYEYQPTSQRGSFSSSGHQQFYPTQGQVHVNGYIDGRGSPFNGGSPQPYPTNNGHGQINYFSPARPSQKISIKPPSSSTSATKKGEKEMNGQPQPTFATLTSTSGEYAQQGSGTGYYPQHYNPYQQNGYDANGDGYYGANGYENWQGVGVGAQGQGYAYEGDYGY